MNHLLPICIALVAAGCQNVPHSEGACPDISGLYRDRSDIGSESSWYLTSIFYPDARIPPGVVDVRLTAGEGGDIVVSLSAQWKRNQSRRPILPPDQELALEKLDKEAERKLSLRKDADFVCEEGSIRLTRGHRSDFSIGPIKETSNYVIAFTKSEVGALVATTRTTTSSNK